MSVPDRIVHIFMDVCNGWGAVLAAGLIFHLFRLPLGIAVLLIPAAWEIFFTVAYGQALRVVLGLLNHYSGRSANNTVFLSFPSIVVLLTKIDAERFMLRSINILHLEC